MNRNVFGGNNIGGTYIVLPVLLSIVVFIPFVLLFVIKVSGQEKNCFTKSVRLQANIKLIDGMPELQINNKFVVPFMSFVNSDAEHVKSKIINDRQITYAAKYGGIHIHQVNASVWKDSSGWNFSRLDEAFMRVVQNDPKGFILLRIDLSRECLAEHYKKSEIVRFADGTYGEQVSIASAVWQENVRNILKATLDYIQSHIIFSTKVVGYNFTAGGGREWFQYNFVENGIDVSEANINRFKQWLQNKYGRVPSINGIYTKLGSGWEIGTKKVQFTRFDDPEVLDYLDYYNQMVAKVIAEFAQIIKKETKGTALVGLYYGYQLELPDARSGHFALHEVLSNPDIDFLSSPVCYLNRNEGGIGAEMTLIDAIQRSGKIYLYECDFRSPHNTLDNFIGEGIDKNIINHEYLVQIFRRQLGYQILKGTGGWTYDLVGRGWYDDIDFWKEIKKLTNLYTWYNKHRASPTPEVVLIINEEGLKYIADPWKVTKYMMNNLRDELYKSSVQFGVYTLNDLLVGRVPESAKLYLMVGMLNVKEDVANKLAELLHENNKTSVWLWDFGDTDQDIITKLTGFNIQRADKEIKPSITLTKLGRNELGIINNRRYPIEKANRISYVSSSSTDMKIWGKVDRYNSFVSCSVGDSKQVFYGSYYINAEFIRSLAQYSGAQIFSVSQDPLLVNSNMVVFHAATTGEKKLHFPKAVDVYDYYKNKWYTGVHELSFVVNFSETRFFFYGNREDFIL